MATGSRTYTLILQGGPKVLEPRSLAGPGSQPQLSPETRTQLPQSISSHSDSSCWKAGEERGETGEIKHGEVPQTRCLCRVNSRSEFLHSGELGVFCTTVGEQIPSNSFSMPLPPPYFPFFTLARGYAEKQPDAPVSLHLGSIGGTHQD